MDRYSGQLPQTAEEYAKANNMQASVLGGIGRDRTAPRPISGVEQQLNRLDQIAEALHQALSEMESRLNGVLMPEPSSTDKATMPMFSPVGVTNRIAVGNTKIESAHARIVSLLERIDL